MNETIQQAESILYAVLKKALFVDFYQSRNADEYWQWVYRLNYTLKNVKANPSDEAALTKLECIVGSIPDYLCTESTTVTSTCTLSAVVVSMLEEGGNPCETFRASLSGVDLTEVELDVTAYQALIEQLNQSGVPTYQISSSSSSSQTIVVQDASYVHTQSVASNTWVVNHNLNKYPSVRIEDSLGNDWEAEIEYNSLDQLTITFAFSISGKAYCN